MYSEKLTSISEYADSSTTTITGYSEYTRSPSGESLNTLATTSRSWKNGLPGEKNNSTGDALSQRIRVKGGLTHKHNYELCKKIRITMALIGILLLVVAIFMLSFYLPQQYYNEGKKEEVVQSAKPGIIWNNYTKFEYSQNIMTFSLNFSESVLQSDVGPKIHLKVYLGQSLSEYEKKNATRTLYNDSVSMVFTKIDSEITTFQMMKSNFSDKCYEVVWETLHTNKLEDCFDTESSHWYGLGEMFIQEWPMDKITFEPAPFLTSDFISGAIFGGVLEPFAVSSKGVGIYIHDSVPLHVSMDNKKEKFCIRADKKNYNRKYDKNDTIKLAYTICIKDNIREVHQVLYNQFIRKPSGVPDKEMMLSPIWSTWVRYKKEVNQDKVRAFATEIRDHGFPGSIFEIDDKYSTNYGDYEFDLKKFSDAVKMLQFLKTKNFRVTMWVCPFSNFESKSFLEGVKGFERNTYFVKSGPKKVPGITKWWAGMGGILDTTNRYAVEWFIKKLKDFQYLPIDGFKFDAGETDYLPYAYEFSKPQVNPNYFSKNYVELVAAKFKLAEVRVGYKSQRVPILVRLLDRTSVWETTNGLQSVLTATLTFGILGYPFVLPDMVGGNVYTVDKPSKELYIRWVQLNAFLPSIQFSLPPWDYDNETVVIVKEALALRQNFSEIIYSLAVESVKTGEPIVRPLWWYWPTDPEALVSDTEFMLGKDYLIAPVLHFNVVSHAVYLPVGIWQEQWKDRNIFNMSEGGFRYYNVSLRDICFFKLITNATALE